jgi:hypothetical protein
LSVLALSCAKNVEPERAPLPDAAPKVERMIAPLPEAAPPAASSAAAPSPSSSATAAGTFTAPPFVGAGEGMNAKGETWQIEVPPPRTCEQNLDCNFVVQLHAMKGFHVNKEYPTKLTMDETPGIEMLGRDPAKKNVFSKANNDFVIDGDTTGTMMVKFRGTVAGRQKVSGTMKFSVCSDANCQMETAQIKATVPVR